MNLLDATGKRLKSRVACGLSEGYLPKGLIFGEKSIAEAIEGETVFIKEASNNARIQYPSEAQNEGIVSILSIPLKPSRQRMR